MFSFVFTGGDNKSLSVGLLFLSLRAHRALINVWIPSVFLQGRAANAYHVYQVPAAAVTHISLFLSLTTTPSHPSINHQSINVDLQSAKSHPETSRAASRTGVGMALVCFECLGQKGNVVIKDTKTARSPAASDGLRFVAFFWETFEKRCWLTFDL